MVAAAALLLVVSAQAAAAPECTSLGTLPDSLRTSRSASVVGFGPGEKLVFSVQYGLITAGEATLEVDSRIKERDNRPTYHIVTSAASSPVFSKFFKVRDRVESFMDTLELRSVRFEKHLREGDYRKDLLLVFDQEQHKVTIDGSRVCDVEPNVQDILSSLYFVRTLPLEPGRSVYLPNHDNGKNYPLEIRIEGRERVTVDAGTFDCVVVEPILLGEAVFKQNGRVKVWMTDDVLHMPVLLKSKVMVGAIAGVLTHFELGGRFRDTKPPAMVAAH